jgi:hypothetical protein
VCIRKCAERDKVIAIFSSGYLGGKEAIPRQSTKQANAVLGIPDGSTYLYAGRAFPDEDAPMFILFGGALDSEEREEIRVEKQMKGGARPFDSGGLAEGHLKLKWDLYTPIRDGGDDDKKRGYFDAHNLTSLSEWRAYFALFVESCFGSCADYWDGVPKKEIDGASFSSQDDFRNWVFELHSEPSAPINLLLAGVVWTDYETRRKLDRSVTWQKTPMMAPFVKKKCRPDRKPRLQADMQAKRIALTYKGGMQQ